MAMKRRFVSEPDSQDRGGAMLALHKHFTDRCLGFHDAREDFDEDELDECGDRDLDRATDDEDDDDDFVEARELPGECYVTGSFALDGDQDHEPIGGEVDAAEEHRAAASERASVGDGPTVAEQRTMPGVAEARAQELTQAVVDATGNSKILGEEDQDSGDEDFSSCDEDDLPDPDGFADEEEDDMPERPVRVDDASQNKCAILEIGEDGVTRCCDDRECSAGRLTNIRFEVPSCFAAPAMRAQGPHSIPICNSHYMDGRNILTRPPGKLREFFGEVVIRKRLCRLCRHYRYLVGSCNGARYLTPGGFLIHTAYRGPQPEPLKEVVATSGDDGRASIFVCIECMEKYIPAKPARSGRPKAQGAQPAPAIERTPLDIALEHANHVGAAGKGPAPSARERLSKEAYAMGEWLAKLARRSKKPSAVRSM